MRVVASLALLLVTITYNNCSDVTFETKSNVACGDREGISECGRVDAVLSYVMMTKNMACVMCHTRVHGDISGFGSMFFRSDSEGTVIGNIFAPDSKLQRWTESSNGTFVLDPSFTDSTTDPSRVASVLPELISLNLTGSAGNYSIMPGERHNAFGPITFEGGGGLYTLTHNDAEVRAQASSNLFVNPITNRPLIHESEFPFLNVQACAGKVSGTITTANGEVLKSPINGNTILVNGRHLTGISINEATNSHNDYDRNCPANKTLTINGEVVVNGDLVLSGCVKGRGTIYGARNIFIPDDIKNVDSAFPYSDTVDKDVLKNEALARTNKDMLSLGAMQFIVIGAIRFEVIAHEEQDPIFAANRAEIENIYSWLTPGTAAQSKSVYNNSFLKQKLFGESGRGTGAVSLIEANLFANKGIAATMTSIYNTNLVINGSVLTPNISMLVLGFYYNNASAVNPFNGRPFANSEINQDFRLKYSVSGYECHRSISH